MTWRGRVRRFFLPASTGPIRVGLTGRALSYVRSYLVMRILVGSIGILLPIALILCGGTFIDHVGDLRGALSDYYHSGMRDVFVGSLYAVAAFLVAYKLAELRTFENIVTVLAGVAAFMVATFPTEIDTDHPSPETPLQHKLTPDTVGVVHHTAAIAFIALLTVMSIYFAIDEGRRKQLRGWFPPWFWRAYHAFFAFAMAGACVFMVLDMTTNLVSYDHAILIGESVATAAFGFSWLAKGLEWQVLFRDPPAMVDADRQLQGKPPGGQA